MVLGSTQPFEVVDAEAARTAGIEVVRRRSGGGAVLVTPDDPVWIDLWVPTGDDHWSADVTGAFAWSGAAWGRALSRLGLDRPVDAESAVTVDGAGDRASAGVEVQGSGPGACTRWSSLVCFGGIGAGEVSVGGRKVVGLSQRRNRWGAWFHTACVRHWDPALLLELLDLSPGERAAASDGLSAAVTGVVDESVARGGGAPTADAVVEALHRHAGLAAGPAADPRPTRQPVALTHPAPHTGPDPSTSPHSTHPFPSTTGSRRTPIHGPPAAGDAGRIPSNGKGWRPPAGRPTSARGRRVRAVGPAPSGDAGVRRDARWRLRRLRSGFRAWRPGNSS